MAPNLATPVFFREAREASGDQEVELSLVKSGFKALLFYAVSYPSDS